ncbi:hypothetical protein OG713_03740 [Streptomyces sp. NBC_00723]|uniref:hypothetical protein n=1 Tax=Streptomyces sp. NBC_00723 TaxID=2903673 RepID=UPI00386CD433
MIDDADHAQGRERQLAAISGVAEMAAKRFGDRPGFDCLLAFIGWEALGEVDPEYMGSVFLTPEEKRDRFTETYRTPKARLRLISALLVHSLQLPDEQSVDLAGRIKDRMSESDPEDPIKPLLYMGLNDDGLAVALAVYDEFWTGKW